MAKTDYPLADTPAARMLADGLARASQEQGRSLRRIGKDLGYKQAVVLSHMANGRVPIPIDRAEELARELDLDPAVFLLAIVEQRHPTVSWSLLAGAEAPQPGDSLAHELEAIPCTKLTNLTQEQRSVIREAASDVHPGRRWLSVHEVPMVETLRELRPSFRSEGLPNDEIRIVKQALLNPHLKS